MRPIPERFVCNNCASTAEGDPCTDCVGKGCNCPCQATNQPVPSGTQDERERVNEPNEQDIRKNVPLMANAHIVRHLLTLLDAERKRVQELQKELGKPEYYWRRRYKEIACVDIFQKQRVQELEEALRKLLDNSILLSDTYLMNFDDKPDDYCLQGWDKRRWVQLSKVAKVAESLLPKEQKRGE